MGKTSTEVKRRYNDKTYAHINIAVPKDLAASFKRVCAEQGVSQAQVLQETMKRFVYGVSIMSQKERIIEIADLSLYGRLKSGRILKDESDREFAAQKIKQIVYAENLGICADGSIEIFMRVHDREYNTVGYRCDFGDHKGESCSAAEMEDRITAFIEELLAEIGKEADSESSN